MIIKREKKDRVRLGWIGVGRRGFNMLKLALEMTDDVDVVWVADLDRTKLERAEGLCEDKEITVPKFTANYFDILEDETVDAVIVMSEWYSHGKIALDALKAGKYTGVEVGCVHDLKECYELVEAYEKYGCR